MEGKTIKGILGSEELGTPTMGKELWAWNLRDARTNMAVA